MISIIIPVYNAMPYLKECLDSLDNQTVKEFEVIIVDDGSTDASPMICDEYASTRAHVSVLHEKNGGQLAARRKGIAAAKKRHLTFLDADDCLRSDAVEIICRAIQSTDADIVCFNLNRGLIPDYMKSHSTIPGFQPGLYARNDERVRLALCTGRFNNLCTKAIKTSLFLATGEEPSKLTYGEDLYEILSIINVASSLYYMDEVLYFYRDNPGSCTNNFDPRQVGDIDKVFERLMERSGEWGEACELEAKRTVCRTCLDLLCRAMETDAPRGLKRGYASASMEIASRYCGDALGGVVASFSAGERIPMGLAARGLYGCAALARGAVLALGRGIDLLRGPRRG